MDLEKIIETAKQQEKWSPNHKWNYGPIDYLKAQLVDKHEVFADYLKGLDVWAENLHRVTDAETYFVWEHSKYDIYVDADLIIVSMQKAFPDVSFKQLVRWLNKHEEKHQITNPISKALVPKEFLNKLKTA